MAQNREKPMFVNRELSEMTEEYKSWLTELKQRYRRAQVRAVVKVNGEMLNFYWELGRDIFAMSRNAKYGDGLLKNVTLDLQAEFPGDSGLSLSNVKAARRWYKTYLQWVAKSQQPVDFFGDYAKDGKLSMPYFFANVPWGQQLRGKENNQTIGLLICRSKDDTIVEWSFEGIERPIGVAEYEKEIKQLIDNLPTPKQIKENI